MTTLTAVQLKVLARDKKIRNWGALKRKELCEALNLPPPMSCRQGTTPVILMNGTWNFVSLYQFLKKSGIQYYTAQYRLMGGLTFYHSEYGEGCKLRY